MSKIAVYLWEVQVARRVAVSLIPLFLKIVITLGKSIGRKGFPVEIFSGKKLFGRIPAPAFFDGLDETVALGNERLCFRGAGRLSVVEFVEVDVRRKVVSLVLLAEIEQEVAEQAGLSVCLAECRETVGIGLWLGLVLVDAFEGIQPVPEGDGIEPPALLPREDEQTGRG